MCLSSRTVGTEFAKEFCAWINSHMLLPSGPLHFWEIDAAHIQRKIPFNNGSFKYIVIVRLVSRNRRNEIFFAKQQLFDNGTRVTITEQLTEKNLQLLKDAREKVGFANAWSNQGKIYISTGPKSRKQIKNQQELKKVKKDEVHSRVFARKKVPPRKQPRSDNRQTAPSSVASSAPNAPFHPAAAVPPSMQASPSAGHPSTPTFVTNSGPPPVNGAFAQWTAPNINAGLPYYPPPAEYPPFSSVG